jgi:hypothetical protein
VQNSKYQHILRLYCIHQKKIEFLSILHQTYPANAIQNIHVNGHSSRNSIDYLYSNEKDDITIEIDEEEQDRLLNMALLNCTDLIRKHSHHHRIYEETLTYQVKTNTFFNKSFY